MASEKVIKEWVDCFNDADVDGLMTLYAADAVHDQVVFSESLQGSAASRELFQLDS
ncbi:MAG: nuclear transport factor 2 family protein [Woeseiaceae bacterium]